jgi:SAM-dependent methyltransferase
MDEARRTSFDGVAESYERGRPTYPAEAVDWFTCGRPSRVVDLGAGTGKFARQLISAGHDVIAVEPGTRMRDALRLAVPEAHVVEGTAEKIPLPTTSVDVVVAAQAYHWFDRRVAHSEIARVLRPGGVFGVLWNIRDDREPWVAELSAILGIDHGDMPRAGETPTFGPLFGEVERAEFSYAQPLDTEDLIALVESRSYVATMPEGVRSTLLGRVRTLAATHPDLAGRASFELPYVTYAYRASRI